MDTITLNMDVGESTFTITISSKPKSAAQDPPASAVSAQVVHFPMTPASTSALPLDEQLNNFFSYDGKPQKREDVKKNGDSD